MNIVKESLAKLLATENLIVEHRPVETAQFEVYSRVLTLPTWEHECNDVIDMFIAHEVGHALYTPEDNEWLDEVPQLFLNVTEDIRIEKLIKRRYEGLPKTFFKGYQALDIDEFFGLNNKDLTQLNLADKINLQYKIGNYRDIPFTTEEAAFLPKCDALETFDDAVALAKEIFIFCQEQLDKQQKEEAPQQDDALDSNNPLEDLSTGKSDNNNTVESSNAPTEAGEEEGQEEATDLQPIDILKDRDAQPTDEQEEWHGNPTTQAGRQNGPTDATPQVSTAQAATESQKKFVNKEAGENIYVEVPKIPINYMVSNKDIQDYLSDHYANTESLRRRTDFADEYDLEQSKWRLQDLDASDAAYKAFKTSSNKEVNYLVKEFEMKKAADGYARATTSRTGILDTANLHTYKYNDDLFKKITTIPDAKSHGLIFNVDWSGSMHHQVLDTIKQTLTLVSFCRKVGIDYDVYLFTDAYEYHGSYHDVAEESLINGKVILANFNMINVLSSKTNKRVADRQQQNLYRLASSIVNYGGAAVPQKLRLGGTPLNESLIAMNDIIPEFKTRTGAQKVHVVCLTDGDGNPLRAGKKYVDRDGTESLFASHMGNGYILRDRKTGRMYKFSGDYYSGQTRQFVSYLRDRFPECSFMNIRLLGSGEWHRFKVDCFGDQYTEENVARANAEWKKTKSFICASSYWTVQYGLAASALNTDAEFEPKSDSKADIKRAFVKSLKGKKMNKKILSSFIEQIA